MEPRPLASVPAGVSEPEAAHHLRPEPARSPESADWRFAVLVLLVLLLAVLATTVVLYVRDTALPEGFATLSGGFAGALIVVIGRRVL